MGAADWIDSKITWWDKIKFGVSLPSDAGSVMRRLKANSIVMKEENVSF